jgi:imidazolonepropionase-like amidohydrolase
MWVVPLALAGLAGCGPADSAESRGPQDPPRAGASGDAPGDVQLVRAAVVLDGRGGALLDRDVVVRDGVVLDVVPSGSGPAGVVHDLSELTLMPGMIDTHVHLGWHFDEEGRLARGSEMPDRVLHAAENGYRMLAAGFTTVQSLGGAEDGPVRDAFARGVLPGPRVLTSLGQLSAGSGGPDELRSAVRSLAERGADVVKLFASESIRTGGAPTMSEAQLAAACGEARSLGLRAVVHAHGPESARRASVAGCTTIEHGALLDRATLEAMAREGTFYDPNIHLIFQNYFDNEDRYIGIGSYSAEGFEQMRAAVPSALEAFRTALEVPGLRTVFGTDAVAGAHGRNAEELVYRVRSGGQRATDAVVSATSLAAESLGLGDRIGTVAPGFVADLIAVEGRPDEEIEAVGRVRWVMRNGSVLIGGAAR